MAKKTQVAWFVYFQWLNSQHQELLNYGKN
jgi:hypothetical protein